MTLLIQCFQVTWRRGSTNLRDQFRAALKKVLIAKSGDCGLPMEEYLSTWQYFQMMFFSTR